MKGFFMKFHVLTLFPEMIMLGLAPSIIGRAAKQNIISINAVNIRDYTEDKHGKVDDYPYGGGAGMLMQAQPVFDAYKAVTGERRVRTIYMTPQGIPFTQKKALELAGEEELVLLCGHYEGIDERVLEEIVTDYISIGDYVLTGGELAAMVMMDAVARLIPGVLGNDSSSEEESFYRGLLEYPQYSRPEVWHGKKVPEVLLSGNHSKVAQWRLEQSILRTAKRRPDLAEQYQNMQMLIRQLSKNKRNNIHMMESLAAGRSEILYTDFPDGGGSLLLYDQSCETCMLSAETPLLGEKLADMLPQTTRCILSAQPFMEEILATRNYRKSGDYTQVLYTQRTTLPMKHKNIMPLSMDNMEEVCGYWACSGCDPTAALTVSREYIQERIRAGVLYGIYRENGLAGTAAIHRDGSLGLLYVKESFRRQGLGTSLAAYAANRILEKNRVPYGHIPAADAAAKQLFDRLRFYQAPSSIIKYVCSEQ